jgi:hypothetical protein
MDILWETMLIAIGIACGVLSIFFFAWWCYVQKTSRKSLYVKMKDRKSATPKELTLEEAPSMQGIICLGNDDDCSGETEADSAKASSPSSGLRDASSSSSTEVHNDEQQPNEDAMVLAKWKKLVTERSLSFLVVASAEERKQGTDGRMGSIPPDVGYNPNQDMMAKTNRKKEAGIGPFCFCA